MANKTKLQRVLDEAEAAIAAKAEETKAALDEVNKTIPALEQMLRDIEDGCGPVDEIKVRSVRARTFLPVLSPRHARRRRLPPCGSTASSAVEAPWLRPSRWRRPSSLRRSRRF